MIRMSVARVVQVDELRLLPLQQRPQRCRCLFDPIAKVMVWPSQECYNCNSKNSRRLLRFTFASGPCFFWRQISQGELSGGQKHCGNIVAAGSMKAESSASTDWLVVRMGGRIKHIHRTFHLPRGQHYR